MVRAGDDRRTEIKRRGSGRAPRSKRKGLAQRRSGAVGGCRANASGTSWRGCCGVRTWRPCRARRDDGGDAEQLAGGVPGGRRGEPVYSLASGEALEGVRLKARLGEMLLARELLEAKIALLQAREPGPLARRMRKR